MQTSRDLSSCSMSAIRQGFDDVRAAAQDGDLDELVHDAAAALASTVNNSGVYKQVEWLWEHGVGYSEMLKHIEERRGE